MKKLYKVEYVNNVTNLNAIDYVLTSSIEKIENEYADLILIVPLPLTEL